MLPTPRGAVCLTSAPGDEVYERGRLTTPYHTPVSADSWRRGGPGRAQLRKSAEEYSITLHNEVRKQGPLE